MFLRVNFRRYTKDNNPAVMHVMYHAYCGCYVDLVFFFDLLIGTETYA